MRSLDLSLELELAVTFCARLVVVVLAASNLLLPLACVSSPTTATAQAAFERLASLEGNWVGEGPPDAPGPMTVNYKLTGGGSALVETLFVGAPQEMVTVYTLEDGDLVLTHFCSLGNQPRMRAEPMHGNVLDFHFIGGANIDPAHDQHLHDAHFEFISHDELISQWTGWSDGRPEAAGAPRLHFTRQG